MRWYPTIIAMKHPYNYIKVRRLRLLNERNDKKLYTTEQMYNYLWDQLLFKNKPRR